ncbi:MAG: DUF547 domain-containing protein, partial [Myxococcota bacterium]
VTSDGLVRYGTLRSREDKLDAYVASLAQAPVDTFDKNQKLAFWVNAYNAITLAIVVDNPQIKSIRDLDAGEVWKTRTFTVGGASLNLDQIEHERARKLTDGRVHAALNCASVGCPPMPPKPMAASTVQGQLNRASAQWVRGNGIQQRGDTLYISEIFKWFPGDFQAYRKDAVPGANEAQTRALWFAAKFSDDELGRRYTAGALAVEWSTYDWALNQAK